MTPQLEMNRIHDALEVLNSVSIDAQLCQLKSMCVAHGIWSVPEIPGEYSPVLYEIQLFGVPAIANDIEALPANWKRAARNILNNWASDRAEETTTKESTSGTARASASIPPCAARQTTPPATVPAGGGFSSEFAPRDPENLSPYGPQNRPV